MTALVDGIDLRYIRTGSLELVRRIYIAIRDESWGTLENQIDNLELAASDDHFTLEFDGRNRSSDIDFSWHARIGGSEDGTIVCSITGEAHTDFKYNRIGFCIHHPPGTNAGCPYTAQTPEGPISGTLPEFVYPQAFEGGVLWPIFPAFSGLTIRIGDGQLELELEGDLFETEDQRNWIDGSYKTYSTPLSLGFPHDATAGQEFSQGVTIRPSGITAPDVTGEGPVELTVGEPTGTMLPAIGLGLASHGEALTARELELIGAIAPDHLRVDLHLDDVTFDIELDRAIEESRALGCQLEIGLFVSDDAVEDLVELATRLGGQVPVARFLVVKEGAGTQTPEETTPAALVNLARDYLQGAAPDALFVGGTDMFFCNLNRTRPDTSAMDGVYWSMNPQIHAFDDLSLMETLEPQADTVETARSFSGDLPLVVSAVTFKPRWNPYLVGPEPERTPGTLPPQVDPRQMSQFGAAWTLGSVKYLVESGVKSVTYYETTGWRGVIEREEGSPEPELFPSRPGEAFPLYDVFAALADKKGASVHHCDSSAPLEAVGFALADSRGIHVHVANLTPDSQEVVVDGQRVSLEPYGLGTMLLADTS